MSISKELDLNKGLNDFGTYFGGGNKIIRIEFFLYFLFYLKLKVEGRLPPFPSTIDASRVVAVSYICK